LVLFLPATRGWFIAHGLRWLFIFLLSFLLALVLTPVARWCARRFALLDVPSLRKIHRESTPLLGGVAIYVSFAVAVIYNLFFSFQLKGVAIGATIVMLAGLADDIWDLPALLKLMLQLSAAGVLVFYGVTGKFLPPTWYWDGVEVVLTIVWVLGITNAMNFLDGMDGLAAGLAIIASTFIGLVALQTNQQFLLFLAMALAGSCLGFFPYNFRTNRPASIFLGDSGSQFIGFTLAGMAVMGNWAVGDPVKAYSMPILILAIPIFDMTYITVTRIYWGQIRNFRDWLEYTGKDHLHHRLQNLGLSKRQTVAFIYFLACSLGVSAIVLKNGRTLDAIVLLFQAAMLLLVAATLMVRGARLVQDAGKEIRRSLTSILGFSEAIMGDEPESVKARQEYIEIIRRKKHRLESELNRLSGITPMTEPIEVASQENPSDGLESRTILVIDDDLDYLKLMEVILGKAHRVIAATDGKSGLTWAKDAHPDLILMDFYMPTLDGFDTVQAIKEDEETRGIPVLAVSAEMSKVNADRAMEAGCVGYVGKPFDSEALRQEVDRVLRTTHA
jgi:UDP-GlcNAc:undecaprenyl-phosphate GlcNAc-1-phosphate transferase